MRVLNKRYWPYQFILAKEKIYITDPADRREQWCEQNLKSRDWRCVGWNPVIFAFKHEEDATVFKLMFA